MSGNSIVLDTNAIIFFFQGDSEISNLVNNNHVIISVISILEYLSFKKLTSEEEFLFKEFCDEIEVVNLSILESKKLIYQSIEISKLYNLKMADSVIAATAMLTNSTLVTADKKFQKAIDLSLKLITR
ncbi:MAG: PIN domain-containing protein [Bacteroidota bacterium]